MVKLFTKHIKFKPSMCHLSILITYSKQYRVYPPSASGLGGVIRYWLLHLPPRVLCFKLPFPLKKLSFSESGITQRNPSLLPPVSVEDCIYCLLSKLKLDILSSSRVRRPGLHFKLCPAGWGFGANIFILYGGTVLYYTGVFIISLLAFQYDSSLL